MTDAEDAPQSRHDVPAAPLAPGPLADASVRTGRPNDAPAIGAVQAETFVATYTDVLPTEAVEQFHPDAFAKVWRAGLSAPPSSAHRVLVACAGEQVVGFAAIGPSEDDDEATTEHSAEVYIMCVHTAARRAGHGSRLLNASADTLKAAHFTAMTCWTLSDDEATHAFATEAGLAPDGAWRDRVVSPRRRDSARSATRGVLERVTLPERGAVLGIRLTPATRQGLSVGVATGAYGIGCGALGVAAGLSVAQTMITSMLLFSGGSQFAFFGVIAAGGSPVSAVATSTLLGARNAFYSAGIANIVAPRSWRLPLAAHVTIDESTAVAIGQSTTTEQRRGFWVTGLTVFVLWNVMTLTGALIGDTLGDPGVYGLDACAAAAFLALLWPRLRGRSVLGTLLLAAMLTIVLAPHTPAGVPVLVAGLASLVLGWPGERADGEQRRPRIVR